MRDLAQHFHKNSDQTATVVENGKLLGIVSRNDLVYNFHRFFEQKDGGYLEEIMIRRPFVLSKENSIWDGLIMMAKKEVSSVAIIERDGTYVKSLDFTDFFKWIIEKIDLDVAYSDKLSNWTFFDTNIMEVAFDELDIGIIDKRIFDFQCYNAITAEVLELDASTKLSEMPEQLKKYRQPQCVITRYGSIIEGIISANEIINFLLKSEFELNPNTKIFEIMNSNISYCMYKHTFRHAITLLLNESSQRLLVVDEDNFPMSIMRFYDILKYITDAVLSEGADLSILSKRAG